MDLLSTRIRVTQMKLYQDRRLRSTDHSTYISVFWNPSASLYALSRRGIMSYETLRRGARRLVETGWATPRHGSGGADIIPWMPKEVEELIVQELAVIYDQVHYKGEWLMQCLLDLLIRDPHRYDNPRPPYLVIGNGSGRLEVDRLYPTAKIAFEFQGSQHYEIGPLTPTQEDLDKRIMADHVKSSICNTKGVRMIHVKPSDLNVHIIAEKIDGLFELYPIRENRPLFRYVDDLCRSYVNYSRRDDR